MSDIVERLRERHDQSIFPGSASTFSEAADEIERLRAQHVTDSKYLNIMREERDAARKEIEGWEAWVLS